MSLTIPHENYCWNSPDSWLSPRLHHPLHTASPDWQHFKPSFIRVLWPLMSPYSYSIFLLIFKAFYNFLYPIHLYLISLYFWKCNLHSLTIYSQTAPHTQTHPTRAVLLLGTSSLFHCAKFHQLFLRLSNRLTSPDYYGSLWKTL